MLVFALAIESLGLVTVAIAAKTMAITMDSMLMPVAALEITITTPMAVPKEQIEHHEGCQRRYAVIVVVVVIGSGRAGHQSHYKQGRS